MMKIKKFDIDLPDYDRAIYETTVLLKVRLVLSDDTEVAKLISYPTTDLTERYEKLLKERDITIGKLENKIAEILDILDPE